MKAADLSIPEARAILIADEALGLSYDQRLASDATLRSAERDAWAAVIVVAAERVAAVTLALASSEPGLNDLLIKRKLSVGDKMAGHGNKGVVSRLLPEEDMPYLHIDPEVFEHGYWRSCTGCHESNEGHATGPYSSALRCNLGFGCHECGGLGATWEQH